MTAGRGIDAFPPPALGLKGTYDRKQPQDIGIMTKPNKANEYHEVQYPAQRLHFFIKKVKDIYENVPAEKRAEAILLLKNEHIDDVELINQAVERVK